MLLKRHQKIAVRLSCLVGAMQPLALLKSPRSPQPFLRCPLRTSAQVRDQATQHTGKNRAPGRA